MLVTGDVRHVHAPQSGVMDLQSLPAIRDLFDGDPAFHASQGRAETAVHAVTEPDRDRLRAVVEQLNVGHVMLLLHFGNLSKQQTLRNTELYAREVMPSLRGLWSEWTDHWYPKPLRQPEPLAEPLGFAAAEA